MKIVNTTGLQLAWIPGKLNFPADSLTLVAKGTYQLTPGGVAAFAEDDQELFSGEVYEDGQPGLGCLYDGDFAYFKPRADAMLLGTCHCPGGQPQKACRASFSVGGLRKSLAVYGDYFIGGGTQATQPQPFTSMPIHYGNSYGGEGYGANPIGKGACTVPDSNGKKIRPLPNIQDVGPPMTTDRPPLQPAGFGPLDRTWAQRMGAMGTYDAAWEKQRWPWFPADYDWGSLNAAPTDQQIKGYLRGDETLAFENLHPEHADYRCALPGIRVRCFLQEQDASGAATDIREVEMRLDTVWIDMDKERLILQWRGPTPVRSQKYEELLKVLLVTEAVGDVVSAGTYHKRFAGDPVVAGTEGQADLHGEADDADAMASSAPPEPPDMAAIEADVKQEVAGELDAMIARQPRSATVIEKVKKAILSADPAQSLGALVAEANVDPAAFDRLQKQERKRVGKILEAHGADPGIMDETPEAPPEAPPAPPEAPPAPPEAPTAADYEARAAAGTGLAGEDLSGVDLHGANLRGADFKDTILSQANLAGADLTGADLSGAVLEGADLGGATLTGATLQDADLSHAQLAGANLDQTTLDRAVLDGADLGGVSLVDASAAGALFLNTILTDATLDRTCLDGADFAGSKLDRAVLNHASLIRASMGNASGDDVSMVGADLTELRAGDGCAFVKGQFLRVQGNGSTWCGARLNGADFSAADLVRADFSGAQLAAANLSAAELPNADLSGTDLTSAQVVQANLFKASFKMANLTGANLGGSNCFQAEFWDAIIDRTQMSGTNLKMTRLAQAGS